MQQGGVRPWVWIVAAGLVGLAAFVFFLAPDGSGPKPEPRAGDAVPATDPGGDAERASRSRTPRAAASATTAPAEEAPPFIEGLVYGEIDLREARELMPDNLYWQLGAPTKDEKVLAERDAEKRRRNDEYGRVLAGDATEDEVRAYYDYRRRLSTDYLEFSEFMARRYREKGPEQFVGMLELAVKMHTAKLAQLDAELEEALGRAREREKVREDWRREQEEFAAPPSGD